MVENQSVSNTPKAETPSGESQTVETGHSDQQVSYDTHRKLLGQRKKDQVRIQELEGKVNSFVDAHKAEEEKRLSEQGEYKKLLELTRKENNELKSKDAERERQLVEGAKYQSFVDALPGKLRSKKYLGLVDIEAIAVDPDTGTIDDTSVKDVVDVFMREHSVLVESKSGPKLPNKAALPITTDNKKTDPLEGVMELVREGKIR